MVFGQDEIAAEARMKVTVCVQEERTMSGDRGTISEGCSASRDGWSEIVGRWALLQQVQDGDSPQGEQIQTAELDVFRDFPTYGSVLRHTFLATCGLLFSSRMMTPEKLYTWSVSF
ncbi:hypothetical protein TNCV_1157101 [Trichonephila clavipes]|nr:hypothetical protein TNCV_1157101 [Trichonephila clavipes]